MKSDLAVYLQVILGLEVKMETESKTENKTFPCALCGDNDAIKVKHVSV